MRWLFCFPLIGSIYLGGSLDRDGVNHHVLCWTVLRAFFHLGNLVCYVLAFHHFTKDRVIPREPRCSRHSDKELRTIGSRTRIGHGQLAWFIELVRRTFGFVAEFIAR